VNSARPADDARQHAPAWVHEWRSIPGLLGAKMLAGRRPAANDTPRWRAIWHSATRPTLDILDLAGKIGADLVQNFDLTADICMTCNFVSIVGYRNARQISIVR
jgi:hypothetical protein